MLLSRFPESLKQKKEEKRMQFTEQQYDEILKQPIGTGIFVYHNAENEVSQLQAKRTEVEVYHRAKLNSKQSNKKLPKQANDEPLLTTAKVGYTSLLKLAVVTTIGLVWLWLQFGAH